MCGHYRLCPGPAAEPSHNFSHNFPSSSTRDAVDFHTSSLAHAVSSVDQHHHRSSSYCNASLPMPRNARLSNGRLGTVSPYDVSRDPSPGWSHRWDNMSPPENHSAAARTAVNLPMRHHLAHIPLNAVAEQLSSNDPFRYSCREYNAAPPPSMFHRIVSLPTRRQRRHAATPARSAQV